MTRSVAIATLLATLLVGAQCAMRPWQESVKAVAGATFPVTAGIGSAVVPIYSSADWSHALPGIRRVVIIVHGIDRDADVYFRIGQAARNAAGDEGQATLLLAPQFLSDIDVETFHLPAVILHWSPDNWAAGEPAHGPAPLSTFDVFDAMLQRLANRALLPNLTMVVLAGHSAGGQVVQRYSVVGRGAATLLAHGIHIRYVVANPSSYLYLSTDRPEQVDRSTCPDFNRWRYGLEAAPPYVGDTAALETPFATRDVIYLLGAADTDPHHPDLGTSCAAEAEGPYRLARGMNYFRYLKSRYPTTLLHRLAQVPNVAHSGGGMFGSSCGLAALFDRPGCPGL